MSDLVCEHVDEHSHFRSYLIPLQPLEHMCLAMAMLNTASIQTVEGMLPLFCPINGHSSRPVLKVDANPFNNL